jgi:hypothetical protein
VTKTNKEVAKTGKEVSKAVDTLLGEPKKEKTHTTEVGIRHQRMIRNCWRAASCSVCYCKGVHGGCRQHCVRCALLLCPVACLYADVMLCYHVARLGTAQVWTQHTNALMNATCTSCKATCQQYESSLVRQLCTSCKQHAVQLDVFSS